MCRSLILFAGVGESESYVWFFSEHSPHNSRHCCHPVWDILNPSDTTDNKSYVVSWVVYFIAHICSWEREKGISVGCKSSLTLLMILSPCIRESEGDTQYLPIMRMASKRCFWRSAVWYILQKTARTQEQTVEKATGSTDSQRNFPFFFLTHIPIGMPVESFEFSAESY